MQNAQQQVDAPSETRADSARVDAGFEKLDPESTKTAFEELKCQCQSDCCRGRKGLRLTGHVIVATLLCVFDFSIFTGFLFLCSQMVSAKMCYRLPI